MLKIGWEQWEGASISPSRRAAGRWKIDCLLALTNPWWKTIEFEVAFATDGWKICATAVLRKESVRLRLFSFRSWISLNLSRRISLKGCNRI